MLKLKKIARVSCLRSIRSYLHTSSRNRLEIILSSEFNDAIAGLFESTIFHAYFVAVGCSSGELCDDIISTSSSSSCATFLATKRGDDNVGIFEVIAPSIPGAYRLHIYARPLEDDDASILILPMITDVITVGAEVTTSGYQHPLLSIYRPVVLFDEKRMIIKEEYGATLGSHLYDSALVFSRYWLNEQRNNSKRGGSGSGGGGGEEGRPTLAANPPKGGVAIELGSGCGIVGILLSRYFERVYATDKEYQLRLLKENIRFNGSEETCVALPLDWASSSELSYLLLTDPRCAEADLIVGADVLYDREAAVVFFALISALTKTDKTKVIIAQKIRANTNLDIDSMAPSFHFNLLVEEADVRLWMLQRRTVAETN